MSYTCYIFNIRKHSQFNYTNKMHFVLISNIHFVTDSNRMAVLSKFGRRGAVKDTVYSNDASGIELSGIAHSGSGADA